MPYVLNPSVQPSSCSLGESSLPNTAQGETNRVAAPAENRSISRRDC